MSAAASFVSSTTVAIISCWQKCNFQDHWGKRRWQGEQGGVVMYPSRYHLHLLLHVRVLLCCNWPYSCFNPACHHPLLEHISSLRLSLSLKRTLHEECFWTELCHSTQFQIVLLGWFNGEVKTIPGGHQYVTAVCFQTEKNNMLCPMLIEPLWEYTEAEFPVSVAGWLHIVQLVFLQHTVYVRDNV